MTATTEAFFDSNVLTYLYSGDIAKAARSEELMAAGGTISVQVLNECALTLRRKFGATWAQVELMSTTLRGACRIVPLTTDVHVRGLSIAKRRKLHIYDGMIVSAALDAGCRTLYSEDMHDGLVIEGLTIRNPYLG